VRLPVTHEQRLKLERRIPGYGEEVSRNIDRGRVLEIPNVGAFAIDVDDDVSIDVHESIRASDRVKAQWLERRGESAARCKLHSSPSIDELERVDERQRSVVRTNGVPLAPDRMAQEVDANRAAVRRRLRPSKSA
jgi:hypothetical protein